MQMKKNTPAQPPVPQTELRDGAIERVSGALGRDLFEFVVATSTDDLLLSSTPDAARIATAQMDDFLLTEVEGASNVEGWSHVLKGNLVDTNQEAPPRALVLHEMCGGSIDAPQVDDGIEQLLVELAIRVYPSCLQPPEPSMPGMPRWLDQEPDGLRSSLHRDPNTKKFEAAMMDDSTFKKVFANDSEQIGPHAVVYCSTGRGGSIQMWGLPGQILGAAWQKPSPTLPQFIDSALEQYRLIHKALGGKVSEVDARVSLAGVLLPSTGEYDFGDVKLRAATPADHDAAPEPLSGQIMTTDEHGATTTINYAGDVIVHLKVPYEVRLSKSGLDGPSAGFPPDLVAKNPIPDVVMRLRASLLLATDRTPRAQVGLGWQQVHDPLHPNTRGWSEPQRIVGLTPSALTAAEVDAWRDWYQLISTPEAKRIHLALSRIVRASGERPDPVDVLIDSVIAWENMFGTNEGEVTFRVTASLAILLEPDPSGRESLRKDLVSIYRLRSKVVHGSSLPTSSSDLAKCFRALDIAIQALRIVFKKRPDLLEESDVSSRSNKLILDVQPTDAKPDSEDPVA